MSYKLVNGISSQKKDI